MKVRVTWVDAVVVALLAAIVYASLSHGGGFVCDAKRTGGFLREAPRLSGSDFLGNLVAYLLLAAAMAIARSHRRPGSAASSARAFAAAVLACSILSLGMEAVQACLPGRVSSGWDWVANTLGAALGWVIGATVLPAWGRWSAGAHRWVDDRRLFAVTLMAALAWSIASTAPWVPSPDIGVFRHNVGAVWRAWSNGYVDPWRFAQAAAGWLAVGSTVSLATGRRPVALSLFAVFAVGLPALRLLENGAGPSVEWLLGLGVAAAVVVAAVAALPPRARAVLALAAVVVAMAAYELEPGYGLPRAFSWRLQLLRGRPIEGIQLAAYFTWFGLAVVACGHALGGHRRHDRNWAIAAVAAMAAMEWAQTQLPGRTPDLSPILVCALAAWVAQRMLRGDPRFGPSSPA
jgi:VanZ family protein